jgi:integral membrane protein (TIGR01906 family)
MRGALIAFGALLLPLVLAGNATRLLLGDWFLRQEYGGSAGGGFSAEQRLELGQRGLEAVRPGGKGLSLLRDGAFNNAEVRHLADVADLLDHIYTLHLLATAALLVLLIFAQRGPLLLGGGLATLGLAALSGVYALSGFDSFFAGFHELLFNGNWRFPSDSTLIRLYPEWFWHDAVLWFVALVAAQAIIAVGVGWLLWRRGSRHGRAA